MPKLKRAFDPWDKYLMLVFGKMQILGYDRAELGRRMGCTYQTVSTKLKDPDKMSMAWVRKLNRVLGITADEARASLPMT